MPALETSNINLQDEQTVNALRQEIGRIIQNDLPDEAFRLHNDIRNALPAARDPNVYQIYEIILRDLSWMILPILTQEERFDLFRTSFLRALQIGINMDSALTRMVYTIPPFIWPEIAPNYLTALRQNTEQIGTEPIEVRGEPGPQPPTLGKYFTDYHFTLGERKVTPLDILQYMSRDPDIIRLSDQEKRLLKRAFYIYEGIKPLSLAEIREHLTPEELEMEELGRLPAPTPEEREALGIPFGPTIAPPTPFRSFSEGGPPVIRLERKPATPYVPPVDLKPKAEQVKPAPEAPAFEKIVAPVRPAPLVTPTPLPAPRSPDVMSGQVGRASLMPAPVLPFTPAEEKPAAAEIRPVHPVVAKPLPAVAPKGAGEATPSTQQPIPTQKQLQKEIGDYRIIRPIGGMAGREPKNINPKDTQPSLEGNVVDLKGE